MSGKRIHSPDVMQNKKLIPHTRAPEGSPGNPVFKMLQNDDGML